MGEKRAKPVTAAQREELRYQKLFEMMPAAAVVHVGGIIVQTNPAMLRLLHAQDPDEVRGRPVLDFVHPDDVAMIRERLRLLEEGRPELAENVSRVLCVDGAVAYVSTRTSRFELGGKPAALTFMLDVTARLQAEKERAESAEMFSRIFHASPEIIAINRLADGRFLDVNEAFERSLGYRREEAIGRTAVELGIWTDAGEREETLRILRDEGELRSVERRHYRKDGAPLDVLASASVIRVAGEDLIISVLVDVTARKRVEEELRRRDSRIQEQNAELIALMWDPDIVRGELDRALAKIVERCAVLIGVDRVSVWRYAEDYATMRCLDLFRRDKNRHDVGQELDCAGFPAYVAAHRDGEIVAVEDVGTDTRTRELPAEYVRRNDIRSLLDVPIWLHDRVGGVLSLEATGERRIWGAEEKRLAMHLGTLIGFCFEIRERRETEEELRRSEEKYRGIFENAIEGIYQTTPEGRYLSVNPSFARMYGYASPAEMMASVTDIGRQLYVHSEDRERLVRLLAEKNEVRRFEVEQVRRDGSRFWISINARRVILPGGGVCFEGTNEDITERKAAEEALRESEARFANFFKHSPELLAISRQEDGLLLDVNDAFVAETGYSREEAVGHSSLELNIWVDPKVRTEMIERLRVHGVVRGLDVQMRRKDGSIMDGLFSAVIITVGGQHLLLTMFVDITLRKQAEAVLAATEKESRRHAAELSALNAELRLANEKLRSLDRQKSEFLTAISHELRTPVATTQVAVENLLRGMAGNITEPQRHLLNIAGRNYGRLGRLIDNLIDLSRLDAQALTLRLSRIDLREAIERAVETFRPIVERDKLRLEWQAPAEPFMTCADQDKIIQIASNLLDNARRFARQVIMVNMERSPDDWAVIRFRDDGPGVADKDLPALFQRFSRFDKDDGKGHIGLGLSIVRSLAEAHGGRAYAENDRAGTTFVVVLPLGEERKPPPI